MPKMALMNESDVSSIVERALKNTNPRELALKGLYFGKLWHSAGDYKNAAEWIGKYLKAYDRDPQAHKLLGECYEKVRSYEAALICYKQSLQIKPKQPELLLHIVELFLNPGPTQNPNKAQVWLDRAAAAMPGSSSVFKLKMELLVAQQASSSVLENAILKELKLRKYDLSLHEQYISLLKTQGKLSDAFVHCNKVENGDSDVDHIDEFDWCLCVVSTYKDYTSMLQSKRQSLHDLIVPQCLLLEALSRFVWLCINEKKFEKAFEYLLQMDETLHVAGSHSLAEWQILEEEMKSQLFWLSATLLIHRADMNKLSEKYARQLAVLLYSLSASKPPPSSTSAWVLRCANAHAELPRRLLDSGHLRLSECMHMIHLLAGTGLDNMFEEILQKISLETVGADIYRHLFENGASTQKSFLCNTLSFTKIKCTLPSEDEMLHFDETSAACGRLNHLVWLGVQWQKMDRPTDYLPWIQQLFSTLRLAPNTSNTSSALLLTLGLTDVEAFIAACVFTTTKQLAAWLETQASPCAAERPPELTRKMTTEAQEKWWTAALIFARRLRAKSTSEMSKMKPLLQRGLETLRGIGNHGLDTGLITKLAKYFTSKAYSLKHDAEVSTAWFAYQRKAAFYWSLASADLRRAVEGRLLVRNKPVECLFSNVFEQPSPEDASSLLSEANMCHGELALEENRIDDALSFYGKATIPQASYCQAQIYKNLSEKAVRESLVGTPHADGEKQKEMYFKKYRHCLEVTLTRLQQHPDDKLHERTVGLLAGLQMSPPRPSAKKSSDTSALSLPGKQSTPKIDESAVANSILLSNLAEKDSVANLVESLESLTSAVSGLKLEMGQLREENRLLQQYASPVRPGQSYATPTRYPYSVQPVGLPQQPGTPGHYPSMPSPAGRVAPTPPQAYIPQPSPMFGATVDPRLSDISDVQSPYRNTYELPQQQPYNPPSAYASYPYQGYGAEPVVNGYAAPSYPGPGVPKQYSNLPLEQGAQSGGYPSQPSTNILAACLQRQGSAAALQAKLGSALATVSASPVPATISQTPSVDTPLSAIMTATATAQEEYKNSAAYRSDVPQKETPFLTNFVPTTPKSPDGQLHFQSPEQMDRENQELKALEQADADNSGLNDTGPHFEPKIYLPEIEVKTGEEDEEVMFQERCRLFRWDENQWKERGVGEIKLLRRLGSEMCRLVMRRDQVHKVCCNHRVTSATVPTLMDSSDRAMVWNAVDFSDEEPKNEQLAARFKTSDLASNFKKAVDAAAARFVPEASSASNEYGNRSTSESNARNKAAQIEPPQLSSSSSAERPSASFPSAKPVTSKPIETAQGESEQGSQQTSMFAGLAKAMAKNFGGSSPEGGIKPRGFVYSFGPPKPKTSEASDITAKAPLKPASQPEPEYGYQEPNDDVPDVNRSGDGPHFEPVIPLPALVETKTGEESEAVTFCQRAKLFRFVDSQWKERGIGDMKILRHRETFKYRIVMRREQVLKLCANHYITSSMSLSSFGSNGKAWTWVAQDFSEPEVQPQNEMFTVRFVSAEHAQQFKKSFDAALTATRPDSTGKPTPATSSERIVSSAKNDAHKQAGSSGILTVRRKPGDWSCPTCFANNASSFNKCPCCDTPNPNAAQMPASSSSSLLAKLISQKPAGTWSCPDCYSSNSPSTSKCLACGAQNPKVPEQDAESLSTQATQAPLFKFGSTGFSQTAANAPFAFGFTQTKETVGQSSSTQPTLSLSSVTFGQPSSSVQFGFGSTQAPSATPLFSSGSLQPSAGQAIVPAPRDDVQLAQADSSTSVLGKLVSQKPRGTWSCPDCFSSNPPTASNCLACNASNPSCSTQTTESRPHVTSEPKMTFGLGTEQSSAAQQSSPFSFGMPPTVSKEESAKNHPMLQRAGGNQISGFTFRFGNPESATGANPFGTAPSANPFGEAPPSSQQQAPGPGGIPKPRLPSVVSNDSDENDHSSSDDDDDDDYSYSSDGESTSSSGSEKEAVLHESPMTKFSAKKEENAGDDVICLGEVLPSKELQEKAEKLQLPRHFYNYLESGGIATTDDDDAASTEPPASDTQNSLASSKPVGNANQNDRQAPGTDLPATSANTFGALGGGLTSFTDLAATGAASGFNFSGVKSSSDDWKPDDKPLFSRHNEIDEADDQSNELHQDKERDDLYFAPRVQLPELVPVVTGEEGEREVYSHRAKLYRFDQTTSQWKERGIGDVCIKHNESTNRYRIVMRREQVLKVCANHYLTAAMKFTPHVGSDNAWTWVAADFSDGESDVSMEKFAIRFKNAEIAQAFKDKIEECKVLLRTDPNASGAGNSSGATSTLINQVEKMKNELGFFKDKLQMAPKVDLQNTFTEDLAETTPENFDAANVALTPLVEKHLREKNQARKASLGEPQSRGNELEEPKISVEEKAASTGKAPFSSDKFKFTLKSQSEPPVSESPGKSRNVSICSERSEGSHADSIHFEPKIPLPDKVDVVTGEENEQVLFAQRAKLYVFDRSGQQWKERGLGDLKLLQNLKTFQIRIVMRREQVFKVCLNHRVSDDMNFAYKDNSEQKVLLWTATDFSDSEKADGELLQFAVRFKTADIASLFLESADDAKHAAGEGRLLESYEDNKEQSSIADAREESSVVSNGDDSSAHRSPVKVPSKPALFSFASVQSPFSKDFTKNFNFAEFAKDLKQSKPAEPAQPEKFNFNLSSMSFNFGSTSTPVSQQPVFAARPAAEAIKPQAFKSLFALEKAPESTSEDDTEKLKAAAENVIAQAETSTFQLNAHGAPFRFGNAPTGSKLTEQFRDLGQLTPEESSGEEEPVSAAGTKDDPDQSSDDDDVIFVCEATPTDDQRSRALQLQLPPTFFMYEDHVSERGDSNALSDEEDAILAYIARRDYSDPDADDASEIEDDASERSHGDGQRDISRDSQSEPPSPDQSDPTDDATVDANEGEETRGVFGSFTTAPSFSFTAMAANVAGNSQAFGSRKDAAFTVSESSKVLFGGQSEEKDPDAYDPEYKPVLAEPPPLIEVKTGEEDEQVLFKERCKLYRFDNPTNSWKERGVGDLKILFHPEMKSHRVVMRRDQVLKVCANHAVLPDMKLVENSEKAWSYVALDRSEGSPVLEKFTVRFKTPEIAANFKQVFEAAQGRQ